MAVMQVVFGVIGVEFESAPDGREGQADVCTLAFSRRNQAP
jgi:hypothetical protein